MQKTQESKVKSARATLGILTGNEEIVAATPGLAAATESLAILVEETAIQSQGQMNTGTEFTKRKNDARAALTVAVIKVCAAVAAHATVSEDPAVKLLKTKYKVTDTEVKRMRDMPLVTFAKTIFTDASPLAELLAPFATEEDVVGLRDLADNFNALLPQKRTQQSKSSLSTQNLEDLISRIDLLLYDTIDVLVKPWEFINPDFFGAYTNARIIVDAPSRKSTNPTEPVETQD